MMKFLSETVRTDNFDNLQPWRVYELREAALTTAGRTQPAGAEFWFEYAIVTRATRDALVHGATPDGEHVVFAVRDDAHRHLFVDTGREWRPRIPVAAPAPPSPPPPTQHPRATFRQQDIRWLAAQPEHARAAAILEGRYFGSACQDADVLRRAALAIESTQPALASRLADRSLDLYHSWMAQATSGGEGMAMQSQIREELTEMRRLAKIGVSK